MVKPIGRPNTRHKVVKARGRGRFAHCGRSVNDPSGSVIGVATVISEITAGKQADKALQKSEEHMRALITASSDVFYSLNPDWQERCVTFTNDGFWSTRTAPLPDGWTSAYFRRTKPKSMRQSTRPSKAAHHLSSNIVFAAPMDRRVWTSSKAIPVFGDDGEITEWFGVAAEVTDRVMAHKATQAANEAQQRSVERHRFPVESVLDYAIFTVDREGKVEEWPPGAQAVFGRRPQEIVGRNLAITYTQEDRAAGVPATELRKALKEGFAENVRRHMRKDGIRVFIEGAARPLPERDTAGRGW